MKRNSRIISAAAAALLAVAPVVSTGVVSAAGSSANVTVVPGQNAPTESKAIDLGVTVSVNNLASIKAGDSVSTLNVTLSSLYGTARTYGTTQVFEVNNGNTSSTAATTLKAGQTYKVVVPDVYVDGLTAGAKYANGGTEFTATSSSAHIGEVSTTFTVPDTSLTGVPYFTSNGAYTTSGTITLGKGENNVKTLASKIKSTFNAHISGTAHLTKDEEGKEKGFTITDVQNDVKAGLAAAQVTVDKDGNFTAPAAPFTVTLKATATNGQTGSINITVNAYNAPTDYSNNPVITYNGTAYNHTQTISLASNASFNYVPVGSSVNTTAIAQAFSAAFSASNKLALPVSVDASKVNTAVAGSYPVTVTAKNANGYTTALTFNLTVGAKAPKTIQTSDGSAAPIYSFNGNAVSNTGRTVANGTQVATFDTITVNGVSYTRINSATSNEYVETKFVNGSQAEDGDIVTGPVMHESIAYDSKGNSTGVVYKDYETIKYVNKVVKINGKTYYKIAGKDQYVRVTNITGTPRKLTHNSYIYRTSTKRTTFNGRWKLYRGEKIVTYGGSYTFKNGKTYFRIGGPAKQYIRVANVR